MFPGWGNIHTASYTSFCRPGCYCSHDTLSEVTFYMVWYGETIVYIVWTNKNQLVCHYFCTTSGPHSKTQHPLYFKKMGNGRLLSCVVFVQRHVTVHTYGLNLFMLVNILMPGAVLWQRHMRAHNCVTKGSFWYNLSLLLTENLGSCATTPPYSGIGWGSSNWCGPDCAWQHARYWTVYMWSWSSPEVHALFRHSLLLYRHNTSI